jgi:hypothetical protein
VERDEFTNGVVDYTSDLIYRNESGVLNESFCDIFGSCIEYFATPNQFDWLIGEEFVNDGIRSMSNPKSQSDPDTYHGQNWEFGNFDNGGVHINSGVQNKWFYLLAEGGSGTNDNGDNYSVEGLGMDTAATIAFYNLRYYLNNSSGFDEARWGAIQAAIELYGHGSPAIKSVMDAWYAVGLGFPSSDYDVGISQLIRPINNGCQLGNGEPVRIELTMNSVADTIFQGDSILIAYQLENDSLVSQYFQFEDDFGPFEKLVTDTLGYLDLAEPGEKQFVVYIEYPQDANARNDTFRIEFKTAGHEVTNLGIRNILMSSEACIYPTGEDVTVRFRYYGCDSFATRPVPVSYTLDGTNYVHDTVNFASALYPGQNYDFTFSEKIQYPAVGMHTITVEIDLPEDGNQFNNTDSRQLKRTYMYSPGERVTFENSTSSMDSLVVSSGRDAQVVQRGEARSTGLYGLMLTGGDVFGDRHRYKVVDSSNIWSNNGRFRSTACICVDAENYEDSFDLQFDMKQMYSPNHKALIFQDYPLASSFRITIDGEQISPTYHPNSYFDDEYLTHTFPLDSFAGQQFELCFEARNFIGRSADIDTGKGDNTFLDNIILAREPVGTAQPLATEAIDIHLYPNPVAGHRLYLDADRQSIERVQIIGAGGKLYESALLQNGQYVDIRDLPNGYYLLKIKTRETVAIRKFIRIK